MIFSSKMMMYLKDLYNDYKNSYLRMYHESSLSKFVTLFLSIGLIGYLLYMYKPDLLKNYPVNNDKMGVRMDMNKHYMFKFEMFTPMGIHQLEVIPRLPAQQVVLLARLVDQCNDIVNGKRCNISDSYYHWNSEGSLQIGRYPWRYREFYEKQDKILGELMDRMILNKNRKQLLYFRSYFDHDEMKWAYRILYAGDITYREDMFSDFELVKDQIEWIGTVTQSVFHVEENLELNTFNKLRSVISKLSEEISDTINDAGIEKYLRFKNKGNTISLGSNKRSSQIQEHADSRNEDACIDSINTGNRNEYEYNIRESEGDTWLYRERNMENNDIE